MAKVEALINSKAPAIAKKAGKLVKEYLEQCVVCKGYFAKDIREGEFCAECRGFVCVRCDCEVFHLSYQVSVNELNFVYCFGIYAINLGSVEYRVSLVEMIIKSPRLLLSDQERC